MRPYMVGVEVSEARSLAQLLLLQLLLPSQQFLYAGRFGEECMVSSLVFGIS